MWVLVDLILLLLLHVVIIDLPPLSRLLKSIGWTSWIVPFTSPPTDDGKGNGVVVYTDLSTRHCQLDLPLYQILGLEDNNSADYAQKCSRKSLIKKQWFDRVKGGKDDGGGDYYPYYMHAYLRLRKTER